MSSGGDEKREGLASHLARGNLQGLPCTTALRLHQATEASGFAAKLEEKYPQDPARPFTVKNALLGHELADAFSFKPPPEVTHNTDVDIRVLERPQMAVDETPA